MNFLEAVKLTKETKEKIRRKGWADGIALYIANPVGRDDPKYKYAKQSCGSPYVATCHIAACELSGVRCLEDVLANDWELYHKPEKEEDR
jgi:hypothetical protein